MAYLICATVLALAAGSYAAFRRASGVMWDVEEQLVPAAAGYRSAPLREVRAKGPPPRTRYALFCAPILGVATLMLFAPVGLFLLAIPPMGFVAISGFIAGPLLVRCANAAARREPIEPSTRKYLMRHHAAVAIVLGIGFLFFSPTLALFSVVMGLYGMHLTYELAKAGERFDSVAEVF